MQVDDLEQLVKAELAGPVAALVRRLVPELVAEQLNGNGIPAGPVLSPADAQTSRGKGSGTTRSSETLTRAPATSRVCAGCGETKPANAFDEGRRTCRRCRNRQQYARQKQARAEAAEEDPRPRGDISTADVEAAQPDGQAGEQA